MTTCRTPPGLGPRGRRLWKAITAEFSLAENEAVLLTEACRTADALDSLAAAVAADGPMLEGKPHPAIVESRQQRLTLARLLASLRVPEDPEESAGRPQRRGAARGTYR